MRLAATLVRLCILAGALLAVGSAVLLNIILCFDACSEGGFDLAGMIAILPAVSAILYVVGGLWLAQSSRRAGDA